jgi:hypothetical protein
MRIFGDTHNCFWIHRSILYQINIWYGQLTNRTRLNEPFLTGPYLGRWESTNKYIRVSMKYISVPHLRRKKTRWVRDPDLNPNLLFNGLRIRIQVLNLEKQKGLSLTSEMSNVSAFSNSLGKVSSAESSSCAGSWNVAILKLPRTGFNHVGRLFIWYLETGLYIDKLLCG